MGTYKKLNSKTSEPSKYDRGSRDMPSGGSRYSEDTPSFESLVAKNAGRGTQGLKEFVVGNKEYSRPKDGSTVFNKPNSRAQYEHEKKVGDPIARESSYEEWKKR